MDHKKDTCLKHELNKTRVLNGPFSSRTSAGSPGVERLRLLTTLPTSVNGQKRVTSTDWGLQIHFSMYVNLQMWNL